MFDMVKHSITLFFQGRLFQDPKMAMRQLFIGILIATVVVVVLGLAGLPLWLAAGLGGLAGGIAQPYLYRNLKYA